MQSQSECLSALKSVADIHKPFRKTFMDAMILFMAIPDYCSIPQLGQMAVFGTDIPSATNETFDWFAFNNSIISKHLTGKRKVHRHRSFLYPQIRQEDTLDDYFWSGCGENYKLGLEIAGHRCY